MDKPCLRSACAVASSRTKQTSARATTRLQARRSGQRLRFWPCRRRRCGRARAASSPGRKRRRRRRRRRTNPDGAQEISLRDDQRKQTGRRSALGSRRFHCDQTALASCGAGRPHAGNPRSALPPTLNDRASHPAQSRAVRGDRSAIAASRVRSKRRAHASRSVQQGDQREVLNRETATVRVVDQLAARNELAVRPRVNDRNLSNVARAGSVSGCDRRAADRCAEPARPARSQRESQVRQDDERLALCHAGGEGRDGLPRIEKTQPKTRSQKLARYCMMSKPRTLR